MLERTKKYAWGQFIQVKFFCIRSSPLQPRDVLVISILWHQVQLTILSFFIFSLLSNLVLFSFRLSIFSCNCSSSDSYFSCECLVHKKTNQKAFLRSNCSVKTQYFALDYYTTMNIRVSK